MAALYLDNLLFLLFVAIAIFFQILTRAATKSRKRPGDTTRRSPSPSQMSRPITSESEDTDADRIRKFIEALGQPTTKKTPALQEIFGCGLHRCLPTRSEEHTSELQSLTNLVCRLLLEKKK